MLRYGIHLDANPQVYIWTNANRIFGGLIAGKRGDRGTGIYVAYSSRNQINSNVFYALMIEPAGQAIFCDGPYTVFHDVRYEAGKHAPNGVEFGPHSPCCRVSFVNAGDSWRSEPVSNTRLEPPTQGPERTVSLFSKASRTPGLSFLGSKAIMVSHSTTSH